MDLTSINTIKSLMGKYNVNFSKSLGQNFLTNPSVCPKMAESSIHDDNTGVIEIGPGIGVLTKELALRAKKVVAVELDKSLLPILGETLSGLDNITIINGDALKIDFHQLIKEHFAGMTVIVCANLPYYITTPIIMNFLESELSIKSITAMVQREAGVRLCAPIPSRESGAVSVAAAFYAQRKILFNVSKGSFIPSPKVDSCVIQLDLHSQPILSLNSKDNFFAVVKAAFGQRRKNISNSLSSGLKIEKPIINELLTQAEIPLNTRAEQLSLEQFAVISNLLSP